MADHIYIPVFDSSHVKTVKVHSFWSHLDKMTELEKYLLSYYLKSEQVIENQNKIIQHLEKEIQTLKTKKKKKLKN